MPPKLIFKHIGSEYRAYGLGVDVGVLSQPFEYKPIYMGLAVRDLLGTVIAWEQTGRKEIIVPTLRGGVSGTLTIPALDAQITPSVDIALRTEAISSGSEFALHYGVEYLINEVFAIRGGMNEERLTFGGGIQLKVMSLDYAWIGHNDLGESHRISLSFRWGRDSR